MDFRQQQVRQFHERFHLVVNDRPTFPKQSEAMLRVELIQEELKEFADAIANTDLTEVADALGDLLFVVYGAAVAFGIDLEPISSEIFRSNMSKGDPEPTYSPTGKLLKGDNYSPPALEPIIAAQIGQVSTPGVIA